MRKSFLMVLLNMVSSALGMFAIWFVTDKSAYALLVVLLSIFFGCFGMVAHYWSRLEMLREELKQK